MSLSSVEQWWEEWQLRILVLASLGTQMYLAYFAAPRKLPWLNPFFRLLLWVAYLSGDALAIYALATLFNRQKELRCHSSSSSSYVDGGISKDLEALWSPVLLMHLGGQIGISAYNIEDNVLWKRHLATAISQVTVTIYVFCNSWSPSADKRLLVAAILLFIVGVFRCLEKPFALCRASFNSVVTSFHPAPRTQCTNREIELEQFIQKARDFVTCNKDNPPALRKHGKLAGQLINQLNIPDKLFVDFPYTYNERVSKLQAFWKLDAETRFLALRQGLSRTFNLIYTKFWQFRDKNRDPPVLGNIFSYFLWVITLTLPIVSIILFHISHKEAYKGTDIKITYLLLYITYFLEIISHYAVKIYNWRVLRLPAIVAQLSIIKPSAARCGDRRGAGHCTCLTSGISSKCVACKELFDQFFFDRCFSSKEITNLVTEYVRDGWMTYIRDAESYWNFTDTRGHKTLQRNGCTRGILCQSIEKPLDESVILWHLATDFCFYSKGTPPDFECATLSRQISNYMMHLLSANPQMLMPGSRTNLITAASSELKCILKAEGPSLSSLLEENRLSQKFIDKMLCSSTSGFVQTAWAISQELMHLPSDGDKKMWDVIRGVWTEMLCFSACRCRGYLHAESLGDGVEYLTFVSLVMSHTGLETFVERQHRVQLHLPKEERVSIARERIIMEESAGNQEASASTEVEIVLLT